LGRSLPDFLAVADEVLHLVIPLPAMLLPELVSRGGLRAYIKEAHLRLKVLFRRHIALRLKGRHIGNVQLVSVALLLWLKVIRHVRVEGSYLVTSFKAFKKACIWLHPEAFLDGVKIVLDRPGVINEDEWPLYLVLVFNDASHGNIGHGEGLGQDFVAARLNDGLLKGLSRKLDNLPVRMNGTGLQVENRAFRRHDDLNVGMTVALFIQDLDPLVKELRLLLIINEIGIIKLNCIGTRIVGHLLEIEVLLGNGKPVFLLAKREK
jgi:hypothetical protein